MIEKGKKLDEKIQGAFPKNLTIKMERKLDERELWVYAEILLFRGTRLSAVLFSKI